MNKQDSMKLQTCVLKVNIPCACDGCKQKIKTVLKKINGVQKTNIDLEQEKVTVYGNADPLTLIKKLNKSGKHAQLWGPQKGSGGGGKGGQQMQSAINKGFKDFNPSNKNQKSVKFDLAGGGGGRGGGYKDEFDDVFDDDDDSCDGYDYKKPNKMMTGPGVGGYGPSGPVGMMNGKNGPSAGFDLPLQSKGKGGNNDAKKGNGGKKSKGGSGSGGFFGGMIGALFGGGKKKHGVSNPKGGKNGGGGGGGQWKDGGLDKKGGGKPESKFSSDKENEFLEFNKPRNVGGGGGGGRNMGYNGGNGGRNNNKMGGNPMMPQMGNYPMGQMTPLAYRGQGMDHGNLYNQHQYQQQYHQQQYMPSMTMMNQPKANMYPQMMHGQPLPSAYGPPMGAPMNDSVTHMFSDENTEGCSIM